MKKGGGEGTSLFEVFFVEGLSYKEDKQPKHVRQHQTYSLRNPFKSEEGAQLMIMIQNNTVLSWEGHPSSQRCSLYS